MVYPIIRWCFCFFGGTEEWYEGSLGLIGRECKKMNYFGSISVGKLGFFEGQRLMYNFDILAIIYGAFCYVLSHKSGTLHITYF